MFFISKLSKREKTIFYITAAIAGLALMNYFIFSPTLGRLNNVEYKSLLMQNDLKEDKAILNRKVKIAGEYQQYESYLTGSGEKQFQCNISQLALESGLVLQGVTPMTLTSGDKQRSAVQVSLEGEMEQVIKFLYAVAKSEIIMSVETFHLRRKNTKESTILCDMTISQIVVQ